MATNEEVLLVYMIWGKEGGEEHFPVSLYHRQEDAVAMAKKLTQEKEGFTYSVGQWEVK